MSGMSRVGFLHRTTIKVCTASLALRQYIPRLPHKRVGCDPKRWLPLGLRSILIRTLNKQPEVMHDWNDTIWTVMIKKAIVHKDGQITFVFQNGTEIKVGA